MPRLSPLHLILVLAVALTGCDELGDPDNLFGEFRADVLVEGTLENDRLNEDDEEREDTRLRGEAVYTIVQTENGPEFILGLFVGDLFDSQYDEYQFLAFRREGGLPGIGAYSIDNDPQQRSIAATYARVLDADEPLASGPILYGTSGTLAITEVDPVGVVSGRFRFDARGVFVEDTGRFIEGTADGKFEARYERPDLLFGRGLDL